MLRTKPCPTLRAARWLIVAAHCHADDRLRHRYGLARVLRLRRDCAGERSAWRTDHGQGGGRVVILRPCLNCGRLTAHTRCADHTRARDLARGTRIERGYGGDWPRLRREFLAALPWCACGSPATEVDHVVPIRDGGAPREVGNLQPLCGVCPRRKTAADDRRHFVAAGSASQYQQQAISNRVGL